MTAPIASGWSESPGGPCTHWKAPPFHGARRKRPSLASRSRLAKRWDHLRGEQLQVRLRPAWRQPGRQGPGVEVGDRHGVRQVVDHAYRGVRVDHLQQPALLQRFSIIQLWSKRLKTASLKPHRVIVDLIDDVLSGLSKRLVGVVGYDEKPKAACETKVICRPVVLLHLGDIAVIYISVCPGHGETIAEADRAAQRRRRKAAQPDRRAGVVGGVRRSPLVLVGEE